MRQQQRSAIAIMAAGLLGGTGVGVAAAHLAQPAQQEAASSSATAPVAAETTTSSIAARINQLVSGTQEMNRKLIASRHDLGRQLRELSRLRERAAAVHETTVSAVSAASLVSPPAVAPAPPSPPPAPHTTTGASGAGGNGDDDGDHEEHEDD